MPFGSQVIQLDRPIFTFVIIVASFRSLIRLPKGLFEYFEMNENFPFLGFSLFGYGII